MAVDSTVKSHVVVKVKDDRLHPGHVVGQFQWVNTEVIQPHELHID